MATEIEHGWPPKQAGRWEVPEKAKEKKPRAAKKPKAPKRPKFMTDEDALIEKLLKITTVLATTPALQMGKAARFWWVAVPDLEKDDEKEPKRFVLNGLCKTKGEAEAVIAGSTNPHDAVYAWVGRVLRSIETTPGTRDPAERWVLLRPTAGPGLRSLPIEEGEKTAHQPIWVEDRKVWAAGVTAQAAARLIRGTRAPFEKLALPKTEAQKDAEWAIEKIRTDPGEIEYEKATSRKTRIQRELESLNRERKEHVRCARRRGQKKNKIRPPKGAK